MYHKTILIDFEQVGIWHDRADDLKDFFLNTKPWDLQKDIKENKYNCQQTIHLEFFCVYDLY